MVVVPLALLLVVSVALLVALLLSNPISFGQFSINLFLISLTVVILFKGKSNTIFMPSLLANKKDNAIDGVDGVFGADGGFCDGVGVIGNGEILAVEELLDMILPRKDTDASFQSIAKK